ncbi:hypothetical protein B0H19DRAFT_1366968 [Mycena capillaripes]|nr:hypothetical protein B0H19DRAFT_1366968 [Mycena capillaripes]
MIEELRAADEEQIPALEDEFRELTMKEAEIVEQLTEVRTAKQRLRRLVAEKKNLYAPIFTLPDELLVGVVEAAQKSADPGSVPIEVVASQVSQRFRWAVFGASSLWSALELRWGAKSDEERFAAYLERSRTCTLSVNLKYNSYHGQDECSYEEVFDLLGTIARHISRIRRLVLHCGGMGLNLLDAVYPFERLHAPCLEYLDIYWHPSELDDWQDAETYLSIFNGGAPSLTTLKLYDVYPTASYGRNPWLSSLTSLDVRCTFSSVDTCILASCPQLVEVTFDASAYFTLEPPVQIYSMPALRSFSALCLGSERPDALITGLIDSIYAPELEILQFSGVHGGSQLSAFFNSILPSKFPALKSLTFANTDVPCTQCPHVPEHIQATALCRFQALASLTIINVCHLTPLLEDLLAPTEAVDGRPSCALPALHSLTLRFKDTNEFGISNWPQVQPGPFDPADDHDPLGILGSLVISFRRIRSMHLRLPRSQFFTERDWHRADPDFEIFDPEPLLRSLGHTEDDEVSESLEVD